MVESYLVIITASVPCLRSLVVSSARQLFASDKSGTSHLTSSSRRKTSSHRGNKHPVQPNREASGSKQNFFGGAPGEDIELGSSKASVNTKDSLHGRERLREGIAKRVDISVTWDGEQSREDYRR
ncbi:hypothetical protein BDV29DRAFT_167911 [Aspergillus leporis]|jgi:hypothetical protein|uniref:Uncharacterized protein n=1 Tax=Aspergillus leporis TaxID=41062 RepID=A0A5N5XAI9_9EURO|nr:hypothetical protein BDV29DRAFT_167911 [Aspergillus leporis]